MSKAMEAARDALKGDFIGKYMSDDYREEVARIAVTAYLAAREAEGAVMVPVEATTGQQLAGHGVSHHQCPLVTYSAMLAARPTEG